MSGEHANAASGGVIPSDAAFRVMNTRLLVGATMSWRY